MLVFWDAWRRLSPGRQLGFGSVSGLAHSEIVSLLEEWNVRDRDEREMFFEVLAEMDNAYRQEVAAAQERGGG